MQAFTTLGCTQAGLCFANCVQLMNVHSLANKYVLGLTKDQNNVVHPHAWVKIGNDYIDPTLQAQGLHTKVSYDLRFEFDPHGFLQLLRSHYTPRQLQGMASGTTPLFPPAIDSNGTIVFK